MKSVDRSIRYRNFLSELTVGSRPLLLDGPISTELDSRGVTMSSGRSRRSPIDEPEALIQLHADYINAGARIVTTHTFGAGRAAMAEEFDLLIEGAVNCALEARRRTNTEDTVLIAGSLAYHTAKGPGKYDPEEDPIVWEGEMNHLVHLLEKNGIDVLILEMVGGPTFTRPLLRAAQASRKPYWVGFSAFDNSDGRGVCVYDNEATSLDVALPGLIRSDMEGENGEYQREGNSSADVIGAMHCKPVVIEHVLRAIQDNGWSGPLMAYPDDVRGWNPDTLKGSHGDDPVDVFCDYSMKWGRDFPECSLLGACCGFSVKHISALNERLMSLE